MFRSLVTCVQCALVVLHLGRIILRACSVTVRNMLLRAVMCAQIVGVVLNPLLIGVLVMCAVQHSMQQVGSCALNVPSACELQWIDLLVLHVTHRSIYLLANHHV